MLDILSVTTPIYLAIATGFLTARFGLFSKSEMRVLGRFVIHIALPALLFNALIQRRFDEILNGTYLAAYVAGSMLNLGLALLCKEEIALTVVAFGLILLLLPRDAGPLPATASCAPRRR